MERISDRLNRIGEVMSEWVTGRKPSPADADTDGNVLTAAVGMCYWANIADGWLWMPSPPMPEPPKPRTLEEVVREYLGAGFHSDDCWDHSRLRAEMREILEGDG